MISLESVTGISLQVNTTQEAESINEILRDFIITLERYYEVFGDICITHQDWKYEHGDKFCLYPPLIR
ncbi:hypothetical protein AALP_AA5G216600 [Arabis alpina]|uniref:Uncharacterized protein n=1 Tax=Arabis alpina TaxID=50452 RepID=A0A087GYL0_ARAAL|nr:hypothetical protein AALP_AA5G216600 [Arabis alpina]